MSAFRSNSTSSTGGDPCGAGRLYGVGGGEDRKKTTGQAKSTNLEPAFSPSQPARASQPAPAHPSTRPPAPAGWETQPGTRRDSLCCLQVPSLANAATPSLATNTSHSSLATDDGHTSPLFTILAIPATPPASHKVLRATSHRILPLACLLATVCRNSLPRKLVFVQPPTYARQLHCSTTPIIIHRESPLRTSTSDQPVGSVAERKNKHQKSHQGTCCTKAASIRCHKRGAGKRSASPETSPRNICSGRTNISPAPKTHVRILCDHSRLIVATTCRPMCSTDKTLNFLDTTYSIRFTNTIPRHEYNTTTLV